MLLIRVDWAWKTNQAEFFAFDRQTSDRMQYFTILKYKLHSFNIQDVRTTRGLIAKPLKKIQNHRYGQPVASFGVFERTLRELLCNIIKN